MADFSQLDATIAAEVKNDIVKIGEGVVAQKKNYDELRTNFEELKKIVDSGRQDALTKEHLTKLAADISTRQEELDKKAAENMSKLNARLDQFEVAAQRLGKNTAEYIEKEEVEAKNFEWLLKARQGLAEDFKADAKANVEEYRKYCKSFKNYLRVRGDDRSLKPEEIKTMSVGIDPDGGYTVTPELSNRIVQRMFEYDKVRQLAAVENITSNAIEFGVDWNQVGAGWEGETISGPETTTADIGKKRIGVFIMYAKPRVTQQLIEDSGWNIENWLANKVADRFVRFEGAAFLTGDGVNKPRGMLTYTSGTTYPGQIQQVNSGAAATVTANGFINLKYAMPEYYIDRGTFLMARATVAATMQLVDGVGAYIWKPSLLANDPKSTLLGCPVEMSPSMPALAANALSVLFADFKNAYLIVDRLGITVQRDPFTAKPLVEFYTRKRVGGDVMNYECIKIGICHV